MVIDMGLPVDVDHSKRDLFQSRHMTKQMSMVLILPVVTLIVGCAGAPFTTTGSGPVVSVIEPVVTGESQPKAAPVGSTAPRGGMRAYKDPVTGKYVEPPAESASSPAPEQIAEPDVIRRAPTGGVLLAPTPDGGTMLQLQGEFRSYSTATKDEDGKIGVHCNQQKPPSAPAENSKK